MYVLAHIRVACNHLQRLVAHILRVRRSEAHPHLRHRLSHHRKELWEGYRLTPSPSLEERGANTESSVTITSYEPNELHYDISSAKGGVVVFSEIYYPGWTATVDGNPVEIGRVNYVLRAINVKPGNHKVVLTFKPQSVQTTETIAYIALALLLLCVIAVLGIKAYKGKAKA